MPIFVPDRLPTSKTESHALIFVAGIAAAAAAARILYGKDEIRWRITLGSVFVSMLVGMGAYSMAAQMGEISGYMGVAIGIGSGLFVDDALRRFHEKFIGNKATGGNHDEP